MSRILSAGLCFLSSPLIFLCLTVQPHIITAIPNNVGFVTTDSQNNGNNIIIEKACSNYYSPPSKDFCRSVLKSNPISQTADLKGLGFIALEAAAKNASEASILIQVWLGDDDIEPVVSESLRGCRQEYIDVVDQIDDSVSALASNAIDDVETWVKAAIADIETCDDNVKGEPSYSLDMSRKNQIIRELCEIVLSVIHALGPEISA